MSVAHKGFTLDERERERERETGKTFAQTERAQVRERGRKRKREKYIEREHLHRQGAHTRESLRSGCVCV